jgi:molybdopterin-containing oxidoreductase family membrane subunit
VSLFFVGVELFTAFYSGIPEHEAQFIYLFAGLHGHTGLVGWMWAFAVLAAGALAVLLIPGLRKQETWLAPACVAVFASLWIEKGLGLVLPGFIPSPLEAMTEYHPTGPEIAITLGVWAVGFLILTAFYKIFTAVRGAASMPAGPTAGGR